MNMDNTSVELTVEDATKLLVECLRNPNNQIYRKYGYDIYLPSLIRAHFKIDISDSINGAQYLTKYSPVFYTAAWDLCRRGLIRPGVSGYNQQSTDDGSAGNGYSITPYGQCWLDEKAGDDFVPTEPSRFAKMLKPYNNQFGSGFQQRTQEAIRCYDAHAYLACCAMCGAAAESALLATIFTKTNDQEQILKKYLSSGGRKKIENILIGKSPKSIQEEFVQYHALLKYWRDESAHGLLSKIDEPAHGLLSKIDEPEAFTSLALLLRFSLFLTKLK